MSYKIPVVYYMIGLLNRDDHVIIVDKPEKKLYDILKTMSTDEIFDRLSAKIPIKLNVNNFCDTYRDLIRSIAERHDTKETKLFLSKVHSNKELYKDIKRRVLANDWTITREQRVSIIKNLDLSTFNSDDKEQILDMLTKIELKIDNTNPAAAEQSNQPSDEYKISNNFIVKISGQSQREIDVSLAKLLKHEIYECSICLDEYVKLKSVYTCNKCNAISCNSCLIQYITTSGRMATCPNCKIDITLKEIIQHLGRKYYDEEYRKHVENVLLEREKMLVPLTLARAKTIKTVSDYEKERTELKMKIKKYQLYLTHRQPNQYKWLLEYYKRWDKNPERVNNTGYSKKGPYQDIAKLKKGKAKAYEKEYARVKKMYEQDKQIVDPIIAKIKEFSKLIAQTRPVHSNVEEKESKQVQIYELPCSQNGCKGFIKKKDWTCILCDTETCKNCLEVKGKHHECNPNAVESANDIKKNTRPCPTCAVRIYKTEGCDQMFCSMCHTAFSWKTGAIEQGRIHNPHYFELVRKGVIADQATIHHGNVPCGGLPDYANVGDNLTRIYLSLYGRGSNESIIIQTCLHRFYTVAAEAATQDILYRYADLNTETLRIRYINNDINEAKFKKDILRIETINICNHDLLLIIETAVTALNERFNELLHLKTKQEIEAVFLQMCRITTMLNLEMYELCKLYKRTRCPHFNITGMRYINKVGNHDQQVGNRDQQVEYTNLHGLVNVSLPSAKKEIVKMQNLAELPYDIFTSHSDYNNKP